jgi:hypothetical protein
MAVTKSVLGKLFHSPRLLHSPMSDFTRAIMDRQAKVDKRSHAKEEKRYMQAIEGFVVKWCIF